MRYFNEFLHEDDAVESMEWLAILVVAAAVIGIAIACGKTIKAKLTNAVTYI